MLFMKRDIQILRFINDFGFCEIGQVEKRFGLRKPRSYKLMRRLIQAGLVNHKRIFHGSHGVYYLTLKGAKCTDLPPIDKITIGQYEHQIIVTNIYLKLFEKYPFIEWVSERQLKHEKFYSGIGKVGHLADGMLQFPDDKSIAIEVELRMKGKVRIERILKGYASQLSIKEVWYYCPTGMVEVLKSLTVKMPFIKVFDITDFLYGE